VIALLKMTSVAVQSKELETLCSAMQKKKMQETERLYANPFKPAAAN
jgi:hypothetical protein